MTPAPQPLPVYLCRIEKDIASFHALKARCKTKIIDSKKDGNLQHPTYTLITSKKSSSYTEYQINIGNCDWREGGRNQGFSRASATLIGPPRFDMPPTIPALPATQQSVQNVTGTGGSDDAFHVVCAWPVSGQYGPGSRVL